MLWKNTFDIEYIHSISKNTLDEALGIKFVEIGENYIIASMPVHNNTVQPFRILHGGASVALAETMGSIASIMCIEDITKQQAVGVEINANHLSSAREGTMVFGKVTPIRVGKTIHVWNIEITNEALKLVCISRLTVAITNRQLNGSN